MSTTTRHLFSRRLHAAAMTPLLAVVFLVACSGDGGSESAVAEERRQAEELAAKVEAQLGLDDGFDAVIFAWERGYSHPQVFDAIDGARLQADGFLTAKSGSGTEQPAAARLGRVLLPDSAMRDSRSILLVSFQRPGTEPRASSNTQEPPYISVERIRKSAREIAKIRWQEGGGLGSGEEDAGRIAMTAIFNLAHEGYTAKQIIDALIWTADREVASQTVFTADEGCEVLRDLSGRLIVPAFDIGESTHCHDAIESAAEDEAREAEAAAKDKPAQDTEGRPAAEAGQGESTASNLAGIYQGDVTLYQCAITCDAQCEVTAPMSLRVRSDGSILGSVAGSADFNGNVCAKNRLGVGPPIHGEWNPSINDSLIIEVEMGVGNLPPVILALQLANKKATLALVEDTRPSDQGRYVQFDAVLTKQ